jgi:hypothetical protein
MANINISVNSKDLYTITLDVFEWQGLTVNDTSVSVYSGPNPQIKFQYAQTTPGMLLFKAISNNNIVIVNPTNHLKLILLI